MRINKLLAYVTIVIIILFARHQCYAAGETEEVAVQRVIIDEPTDQELDSNTPTSSIILQVGSTGSEVVTVQCKLGMTKDKADKPYFKLPSGAEYGYFGEITDKSVRKFQTDKKLAVDGMVQTGDIVGETWKALGLNEGEFILAIGSEDSNVTALQQRLKKLDCFNYAVSGKFDTHTEEAVNWYKDNNGLENSSVYRGKVGKTTWGYLFKPAPKPPETGLKLGLHKVDDRVYNADGELMVQVGAGIQFPYAPAPARILDEPDYEKKYNFIPYSSYQKIIDEMQKNWNGAETVDVGGLIHTTLDVVGLVPVIGEPCDGLNAIMYLAEGDKINALLCAGAIIPIVGDGITGVKLTAKGAKYAGEIADGYKYMRKVEGFETFDALKKVLGPAGEGKQWHHIVEQCQISKSGFGTKQIQNIENVVAVPSGAGSVHSKLNGYYSSKYSYTDNKTLRDWLTGQSYEKQFEEGLKALRQYGDLVKNQNGGWKFIPYK